ncbi:hypothetical protein GQ600_15924 [Phytophthora cactorum]|nr:hypothetical protein GQ600_15924 [Phytophthora cactorum]
MALNIYADAACDYLRLITGICDESRLLKPVILATHSNIVIQDSTLDPTILNTDKCDENNYDGNTTTSLRPLRVTAVATTIPPPGSSANPIVQMVLTSDETFTPAEVTSSSSNVVVLVALAFVFYRRRLNRLDDTEHGNHAHGREDGYLNHHSHHQAANRALLASLRETRGQLQEGLRVNLVYGPTMLSRQKGSLVEMSKSSIY